jgi:hypothetical protein
LLASDGAAGDRFGAAACISGDGGTVIVGAHGDDNPAVDSGSVYIYSSSGSTNLIPSIQTATFSPSGPVVFGNPKQAGYNIAVSKNGLRAAINWTDGDGDTYNNVGGINIYSKATGSWVLEKTYNGENMRKSGHCMCFTADGNTLFFGEVNNGAYSRIRQAKFENSAWSTDPSVILTNITGSTVILTLLIVGDYSRGNMPGEIKFYNYNGTSWNNIDNYERNFGLETGDGYGKSLSLSGNGDYLAVGGSGSQQKTFVLKKEAGNAYHSTLTDISAATDLANDTSIYGTGFGYSVAMNYAGDVLAVSAPYKDENSRYNDGAVYIYTRTGESWNLFQKITNNTLPHNAVAQPGDTGKSFGHSLAISDDGSTIYVSALNYDSQKGAVFVYTKVGQTYLYHSKIQPSGTWGSKFGEKVAYNEVNDELFVSSIFEDSQNGKVWIFN